VLTEQILALMRRCAVDAAIFGGAHPPRRGEEAVRGGGERRQARLRRPCG
jgi:hypothetical protein